MPRFRTLVLVACSAGALGACGSHTVPVLDAGHDDVALDITTPDVATSDVTPADTSDAALPDLTVDEPTLREDVQFVMQYFAANACELGTDEACVGAPGWRRLMMFTTLTPNIGDADLDLGNASMTNPNFTYSTCHEHYHFLGYADYSLVGGDGGVAAEGHKQSFCVEDLEQVSNAPGVRTQSHYDNCGEGEGGEQGISQGWADDYYPNLPCQWIDVTDVPAGDYSLRVSLNYLHHFAESDYSNNVVDVAVTIPATWAVTTTNDPTRTCGDNDPSQGIGRDCDWRVEGRHTCTPGETVDVGCNSACNAGSCSGNWQIRVCRGAATCLGGDAANVLQSDYGLCGSNPYRLTGDSCPAAIFTCPPEGNYTVMVEPEFAGEGHWSPSQTASSPDRNLGYCQVAIVSLTGTDAGVSTDGASGADAGGD